MIWLVSYPRSGNTFFRNVLYNVYGINSYVHSRNHPIKPKESEKDITFIKTHLFPEQLTDLDRNDIVVYLIRDGRDADVSLAHHRREIKLKKVNYYWSLFSIILGKGNAFPGGWSDHVYKWSQRANAIISFENLIEDPEGEIEKLRKIISLPISRKDAIPTFEDLKSGKFSIGTLKLDSAQGVERKELAKKFFRRGKVGSYKDEMPYLFRILFWMKNRKMMKKFNYY